MITIKKNVEEPKQNCLGLVSHVNRVPASLQTVRFLSGIIVQASQRRGSKRDLQPSQKVVPPPMHRQWPNVVPSMQSHPIRSSLEDVRCFIFAPSPIWPVRSDESLGPRESDDQIRWRMCNTSGLLTPTWTTVVVSSSSVPILKHQELLKAVVTSLVLVLSWFSRGTTFSARLGPSELASLVLMSEAMRGMPRFACGRSAHAPSRTLICLACNASAACKTPLRPDRFFFSCSILRPIRKSLVLPPSVWCYGPVFFRS